MIKVDKKIKVTKYLGMVRVYSMANYLYTACVLFIALR
jgi:hypothetical protein